MAVLCTGLASSGAATAAQERVHVLVRIDGRDDLHLSQRRAAWVHHEWDMPERVEINGREWDPERELRASARAPLLSPRIELCGAVLRKLRGRGEVGLSIDSEGLVIHFDDSAPGSDVYEVVVEFASVLCRQEREAPAARNPIEVRVRAQIDGTDEIRFVGSTLHWLHHEWRWPEEVEVDGRAWDLSASQVWPLGDALPESADLANARVRKLRGRGSVELVPWRGELSLSFDDPEGGADTYEALVVIPHRAPRHLVSVETDAARDVAPGTFRLLRPEGSSFRVVRADAVLDARGRSQHALDAGPHGFELLRGIPSGVVCLSAGPIEIGGDATVRLPAAKPERLAVFGPEGRALAVDELAVRSELARGEAVWRRDAGFSAAPTLLLSPGARNVLRIFARSGRSRFALWTPVDPEAAGRISIPDEEWIRCELAFASGTPKAVRSTAVLHFADGTLEIPEPHQAPFFTNRRAFGISYRLELAGGRVAVFGPRAISVGPEESVARILLGGEPSARGAALILDDESVGGRRLWFDALLADARGHLLDKEASSIDWLQEAVLADGSQLPAGALDEAWLQRLVPLAQQVSLRCSWKLDVQGSATLGPAPLVQLQGARCSTGVPDWLEERALTYLDKVERALDGIAAVRGIPLPEDHRVEVRWWLNSGAVGGGGGVSMPLAQLLASHEPFLHPWAITHEILHTLGYGHGFPLNRIDWEVQELFEGFQWQVGGDPAWTP